MGWWLSVKSRKIKIRPRTLKILTVLVIVAILLAGYMRNGQMKAFASVQSKFLTGDGAVVNTDTTSSLGSYSDTSDADSVYFSVNEVTYGDGGLAWDFDSWQALTGGVTGSKVTKVELNLTVSCVKSGDPGITGDELVAFKVYNWNTGSYDLTLGTRKFNNAGNSSTTITGPNVDYSAYFNESGFMKMRMEDISELDNFATELRIDYMEAKVYLDIDAPTATWQSPNGDPLPYYTSASAVVLQASGTDNSDPEQTGISSMRFFYHNGLEVPIGSSGAPVTGTVYNGTWANTWNNPDDGEYTVYARAYDAKGNISSTTAGQDIIVDRTPPVAALTAPVPDSFRKGSFTIKGTATDANFDRYKVEYATAGQGNWTQIGGTGGSAVTDGNLVTWDAILLNGVYDIRLTVDDKAGNSSTTVVDNVTIDNTAPAATIAQPTGGYIKGNYAITGNASDTNFDSYKLEYSLTGANSWNQIDTDRNIAIDHGTLINWNTAALTETGYDIRLTVFDKAANSTTCIVSDVKVDNTTPVIAINSPASGNSLKGTSVVTGIVYDGMSLDHYIIGYAVHGSSSWHQITTSTTPVNQEGTLVNWNTAGLNGTYDLRCTAYDSGGNSDALTVTSINIDNTPPRLSLQYYTDPAFTEPLGLLQGNPVTKDGTLYIKLVSNETLSSNAGDQRLTIDAPGTANDVTDTPFTWDAVSGAWVYAWNITSGGDGESSISVKAVDVVGNVQGPGAPVSGGILVIDNSILPPALYTYTIDYTDLTLTWSGEEDFRKYYVYSSAVSGFTPDESNLVASINAPTDTFTKVLPSGTSFFKIRAVDQARNMSAESNELKVYAQPYPTTGFLRYADNGPFVSISVYWDDSNGGSSFRWANDVDPSGGRLAWQTAGLNVTGRDTANAVATLPVAEKYKNYYFELIKGGKTNIIKAFPVDFDPIGGPRFGNDYAHGNFNTNTDLCSSCHTAHSALKSQLLKQATYYDLCMLCHGNSTSQSKYDVERGMVYVGPGNGVAGWVYSPAGPIKLGTSGHTVDDRGNVDSVVYGSESTQILTFTCISCHKGHGGPYDNYRLIKNTIYPANGKWNPQTVNFTAYAVVRDYSVGEEVYLASGNTEFCSACHLDYDEGNAYVAGGVYSVSASPGPGTARYRHPVTVGSTAYSVEAKGLWPALGDVLPLQYYPEATGNDKRTAIVCSTCHFAHGTTKSFNVTYPEGTAITNQKILRLDNYGVCQSCHKK